MGLMTMTMTMTMTHGEGHGEGGHILEEVDRGLEDHSESHLESIFMMMVMMKMMKMMMTIMMMMMMMGRPMNTKRVETWVAANMGLPKSHFRVCWFLSVGALSSGLSD